MSSDGNENWVLGVTLGLLGSIAINTGNNIQSLGIRNSQSQESVAPVEPSKQASPDRNPLPRKKSISWLSPKGVKTAPCDNDEEFSVVTVVRQSPITSMTWVIGTVIFVAGSLLNFASYAFAAQSMLASLESVQFVTNLLFGKFMLGARVTQTMLAGTLLAVAGTVMAVQFSSKETLDLGIEDIQKLYQNPAYLCYLMLVAFMLVALHFIYHKLEEQKKNDKPIKRSEVVMPCIYSVWSALFGTQSVVQAKVLAELLAAHSSGSENIFKSWFTYATVLLWIVTVIVWLKRLNDALVKFNPLFIIPLLQCSFIFFAIVSGGIFFQEFVTFDANQWVGFWFGITVMFGGLVLLTPHPVGSEDEDLHRELVNLILERRGSSSVLDNSFDGHSNQSSCPIHESNKTRARINSTDGSSDKEQQKRVEKSRSPRFSKENMTRVALEVMNESAKMLQGGPCTRILSDAMVSATVDADDRRRRRKSLEMLLWKIKEDPISTDGYNDEIMGLIKELNIEVAVSPPRPERDIKTHLSLTQEKLRSQIELEIQQNTTPREGEVQPVRDLNNRFNQMS